MKTKRNHAQKWFLFATLALVTFGELAYVLDSRIDCWASAWRELTSEKFIENVLRESHFLLLIMSIAVGVLLYERVCDWRKRTAHPRRLSVVLGILLLLLNLFSWAVIYSYSVSDRDRIPEDVDIHAEIQYTRSKSHWFGRGEPYYTYQDTYPTPDMTDEEYLQMCDISDRETSRAYELERQPSSMLPILDYCYGKWVSALYALIAVFWCVGAIMGWKTVRGSWNRVLYGSCFLLLAAQVLGPLLEQLGILIWSMPVLFSEMDWDYWVLCVVPFFAAMAALITGREGNEQPLT